MAGVQHYPVIIHHSTSNTASEQEISIQIITPTCSVRPRHNKNTNDITVIDNTTLQRDCMSMQTNNSSKHSHSDSRTQVSTHASSPATQVPMSAVTTTQSLDIKILTINVRSLKSKLLLRVFMVLIMNYDVVCMCETRCDDADTNNKGSDGK